MNIDNGEIARLSEGQRAIIAGMQRLPRRLLPLAEAHLLEYPDEPVDLDGESALANYASEQRAKRAANPGSFGKCKNRPR